MAVFFIVFFVLFSAINYYISVRGWQALQAVPHLRVFYLVILLILAFSYLAAKIFEKHLPTVIYDKLIFIGSFWFACILYFILIIVLLDLTRLLNSFFNIYPSYIIKNYPIVKLYTFIISVIIVGIILLYGFYNSRNFVIKTLDLELPQKKSSLNELNIVQISDIHLSAINDEKWLNKAVEKINSLNPDIVLIAGDLVDERAYYFELKQLGKSFKKIKNKYGIFASTGNHEYINGAKGIVEYFSNLGITWILDTSVFINNNFYVAARLDTAVNSFTKMHRKSLDQVLRNVNIEYPIILMDHTPFKLNEAEEHSVDLQLSGHTHNGQMFPLNWITNLIYEISWGYGKKSNTQYYVSSGMGSWGPPVKIASDAEIVNIRIKFIK
ncbi:MAG TPA: metallophosphoesterase [Ignavibacteriaceae bacterium]|nr:metallophosphoesterase [Ignavibacteriaceae bacterium]